ncbi:substrate-binding domain-containing protein [Thalassiella azotivora]
MGRHSTARRARPKLPWWAATLAGATVLALVAVLGVPALRGGDRAGAAEGCRPTSAVRLVVSPDIAQVVGELLAEPVPFGEDQCTRAALRTVEPVQAASSLTTLDASALPHLWIPDSSLWLGRAGEVPVEPVGSFATSPVVIGTSREAADELGWVTASPSWAEAARSGRQLAVPDLISSAEGIAALAAIRASLGGDEDADNAVVQAVVAARRGEVPTAAQALTLAADGGASAPLVPLSERDVHLMNRSRQESRLMAVYPSDGSPYLDYPVIKVGAQDKTPPEAVAAVVQALASDKAKEAARLAGFRDVAGTSATGTSTEGTQAPAPQALATDPQDVAAMLSRLSSLSAPSRVLTVYDVSTSMAATDGGRQTRIELARDAAKSALAVFPDNSRLGAWVFASRMQGDQDWAELSPTRELTEEVNGVTQREYLAGVLDTLPDRLTPGGTSLYDTTLAAFRHMQQTYDEEAVNTLTVITDGKNEDSTGIQLEQLLSTLAAEQDPDRPIIIVTIGLGPDADDQALSQIATQNGAQHFQADDPNDLQNVLFEMLRRRS